MLSHTSAASQQNGRERDETMTINQAMKKDHIVLVCGNKKMFWNNTCKKWIIYDTPYCKIILEIKSAHEAIKELVKR